MEQRKQLILYRHRRHLTLEQASQSLEVDAATLQRWEQGKTAPRGYNLQRLCEFYEASAFELGLEEIVSETTITQTKVHHAPSDTFVIGDLTMQLLALAFVPFQSLLVLQDKMTRIIEEFDMANTENDAARITRRDALSRLATLPMIMFGMNALHPVQSRSPEEIVTQCAASIAACWELSKSDDDADLALAFRGVSAYLPSLDMIVHDSSRYRKEAAGLAGQCELLRTLLGWHLQGLKEAAQYAQNAVEYCIEAGDQAMLLSVLDYQAWALYYDNRPKQALAAIEQALPLLLKEHSTLSSALLGGVYSTLALMNARVNRDNKGYLRRAANSFFLPSANTDNRVVYMDYTHGDLILNDGMVHYHQHDYDKATTSLSRLVNPETLTPKIVLPERSEVEALNIMTLAQLKAKNKDMEKVLHTWDTAITKAKSLKSEQRFSEAITAYEMMQAVWPGEKKIAERCELATHW